MEKIFLLDSPNKTLLDELAKTLSVEFSKNYKLHIFKMRCDEKKYCSIVAVVSFFN